MKTVSNEAIISALLQHGTVKEAAEAVGISPRAIYDRMQKDREFRGEYAEAKASILRKAVHTINEKLSSAFETVADIMEDTDINPSIRLQAAQTIISNAVKFSERLTADERHAREERTDPAELFGVFEP